jgi:lysophospholipase L1-like esterase
MRSGSRISRPRAVIFALITLCASVGIVELFARLAVPASWYAARKPSEDALLTPHAVRGYGLRANLERRWVHADFDVPVRLNERGLRDDPVASAGDAPVRVLAAGDSYTFGIGVEAEQSWPEQLQRRLDGGPGERAAVLNSGVPGYGARQIRQSVQELLPELKAPLVIVGMYANSYWRVENPYVIHGGTLVRTDRTDAIEIGDKGELLLTAFAKGPLRSLDVWLKQYLHAGAHGLSLLNGRRHWPQPSWPERTPEAISRDYLPALTELGETQRFAHAHGAQLVVLAINPQQADGSFADEERIYNAVLGDYCERAEIHFVDPLPELVRRAGGRPIFRFASDQHWSAAAHEVAAELLDGYLKAKGLLDRS